MAYGIESQEVILALLLVKALLALLAALIFIYYKASWDNAKRHLPVHLFYAKWKTVRHAVLMGIAAIGFALGFAVELAGVQYGLSANMARFLSGIFEVFSMFFMLYFFFTLAIEDVPAFQHMSESTRHRQHAARQEGGAGKSEGGAQGQSAQAGNDWTVPRPPSAMKRKTRAGGKGPAGKKAAMRRKRGKPGKKGAQKPALKMRAGKIRKAKR